MLLAVDIGNTNIVAGVFKDDALKRHWRISTSKEKTSDEYGLIISGLIASAGLTAKDITGAIICSVVPSLDGPFAEALSDYLDVKPYTVGVNIKPGMPVVTDNPAEVGSDRIVNAVAAAALHKPPLIVVDFGTAVTFDYVTGIGEYAGGVIAPGISISAEALFRNTAKLSRVDVGKPSRVIGRNTVESMQSGVYYGFIGLVDGVIERMIKEVKAAPRVVATGGLAPLVIGESRFVKEADEFLTLKGLKLIYEGNR